MVVTIRMDLIGLTGRTLIFKTYLGALTLKSFPFELRGWDIKSYESINPTDSFGQDIRVYIENNQIIKIEPEFANDSNNNWLTDKGRQFFDSIFEPEKLKNVKKSSEKWGNLFQTINKTLYTFNICNLKNSNKYFFIIVFEHLSLEVLNLLFIISQMYTFIKLKRAENYKINNDLESNFQLNSVSSKSKLLSSSLCLLLGINSRYENSNLNLTLRQRYLKGNFEVLSIGSLFDFSFSVSFLGSNISILNTIIEGNNLFCVDLKLAKNPLLVTNTDLFKRNDSKHLIDIIKVLKFTNIISKTWNGLNISNSYLNESGVNSLFSFSFLTFKDLISFSSLYTINVRISNITNFKKLVDLKLLNFIKIKHLEKSSTLIDQNLNKNSNIDFIISKNLLNFSNYLYLPSNTMFENQESFINTEGLIKRTTKLLLKKKTKSNWKLIRKFIKCNKNVSYLNNSKNNKLIYFDTKNSYNFKNFINFQYFATQSLTDLNFYLNVKNNTFTIYKKIFPFKLKSSKVFNTKIKYWLDDFYNGGKDNYCHNSLILNNCSKNLRLETTNFF